METIAAQAIGQVIQLAIAPVFLLTGIAGVLSVLSQRLSRAVDRSRLVDRSLHNLDSEPHRVSLQKEATTLYRRTQMIHWAMRLAVGSALMICIVVVCLFIDDVVVITLGIVIASLFIIAMLFLIASLVLFILEVSVHTRNMQHNIVHLFADP